MASAESAGESKNGDGGKPMLARQREQQGPGKNGWFPLSMSDGWSQWWAGLAPAVTEHRVMSFLPYLQQPPTQAQTGGSPAANGMAVDKSKPGEVEETGSSQDPWGPRRWHSEMVQLSGKNRALNEFSVERIGEETENSLVLLHGYGAGLGFFYKNFEALSRLPHWKLYALDMLGMGRSSRPPFKIKAREREAKIRETESWFVDALEEWRVKRGIEKMTLLGHSMGGYMAVCYALKYPGHLNKLILASPVGIPLDPWAVDENTPEQDPSKVDSDMAKAQNAATNGQNRNGPPRVRSKIFTTLWDANISVFSFVRMSGPLGPRLVSGWTSRRFGHLPTEEAQALHEYSYSLFRQRGSGEYALAYVLAPGAFARSPLIRRIHSVGRQYLQEHQQPDVDNAARRPSLPDQVRETGIPIVFMYGELDWMDVNGGIDSIKLLDAERKKALSNASPREKALENGSSKLTIIKKAGHHLYLEGWEQFNEEMLAEMKDVEARQKRLAAVE